MDLASWLQSVGLSDYTAKLAAEAIDAEALKSLSEADLERLGIANLGDRRRLLAAVAALAGRAGDELGQFTTTWPFIVAAPLRAYVQETHPVLRLWAICDTLELLLRFLVSLGIAERRALAALDHAVVAALKERISTPTLGKWLGMAGALTRGGTTAWQIAPETGDFVHGVVAPLLDGSEQPQTVASSLLRLRDRALAHRGVPLTRHEGAELVAIWGERFAATMRAAAWLGDIKIVVRSAPGGWIALRGGDGEQAPTNAPAAAVDPGDGVWAVRGGAALSLRPLALFRPPRFGERAPGGGPATHVYVRRGSVRLQYTPLGAEGWIESEGDEGGLAEFLTLFRLGEDTVAEGAESLRIPGFEKELRQRAEQAIDREVEVGELLRAVEANTLGHIWVAGTAGIGKSFVMAMLATALLDSPPAGALVLPYRFTGGDVQRCSRDAFLLFAIERLDRWKGLLPADPNLEPRTRLMTDRLAQRLARLSPDFRVIFVLDGLDEIGQRDPGFAAEVVLSLAADRVLWVAAGRPEQGLDERFRAVGALRPFPLGLPRFGRDAIRNMLLERLGPLRRKLLANDAEQGDEVLNPFIELVADRAEGLPIYVSYVVADVLAGLYSALDGEEGEKLLPKGLGAYHERLVQRLGVGGLHQVVTPIAATLAVAEEPLTEGALVAILEHRNLVTTDEPGRRLIGNGLSAIASMLRLAPTLEGLEGFLLHHPTLARHIRDSAVMHVPVATARRAFVAAAKEAGALPDAAHYLYRNGVTHLMDASLTEQAAVLLSDIQYQLGRLKVLAAQGGDGGIRADWDQLKRASVTLSREQEDWRAFWATDGGRLYREPGANGARDLVECALTYASDTTVGSAIRTLALAEFQPLLMPLLGERRRPCLELAVFYGHSKSVRDALELSTERILSWAQDATLRLWSLDGQPLGEPMHGHDEPVDGALQLTDGNILSWSRDGTLRLWSLDGQSLGEPMRCDEEVLGGTELSDHRILSWSRDGALRLWSLAGQPIGEPVRPDPHVNVYDPIELSNRSILSRSSDKALRLWSHEGQHVRPAGEPMRHEALVLDTIELSNGCILSISQDGTFRRWSLDGQSLGEPFQHGSQCRGAIELSNRQIISWAQDGTLRLWSLDGQPLGEPLQGWETAVFGAIELSSERILAWSDKTLRLWDLEGHSIGEPLRHGGQIWGAMELSSGLILSYSDKDFRFWTADGQPFGAPTRCDVFCMRQLSNGHILSWGAGGTLRLWSSDVVLGDNKKDANDQAGQLAAIELADGGVVSWTVDNELGIWSPDGEPISGPMRGHGDRLRDHLFRASDFLDNFLNNDLPSWAADKARRLWNRNGASDSKPIRRDNDGPGKLLGAAELSDGRILSWAADKTLRLWNHKGDPVGKPMRHDDNERRRVLGAIELSDGRIPSWSASLRLWSPEGEPIGWTRRMTSILGRIAGIGPSQGIREAIELSDGHILSWSGSTLQLWNREARPVGSMMRGHTADVLSAIELSTGRILSRSVDGTLRLWTAEGRPIGGPMLVKENWPPSAIELSNGRILSWSDSGPELRLWSQDGTRIGNPMTHTDLLGRVSGAVEISKGRVLSWGNSRTSVPGEELRIWSPDGEPIGESLRGHTDTVDGVIRLSSEAVLSWDRGGRLRIWNFEGEPTSEPLVQHSGCVVGVVQVSNDCFLSWSKDNTIRLWSAAGQLLTRHVSWSGTPSLRSASPIIFTWAAFSLLRLDEMLRQGRRQFTSGRQHRPAHGRVSHFEFDGTPFYSEFNGTYDFCALSPRATTREA